MLVYQSVSTSKSLLKMFFLFARLDILVPWRVHTYPRKKLIYSKQSSCKIRRMTYIHTSTFTGVLKRCWYITMYSIYIYMSVYPKRWFTVWHSILKSQNNKNQFPTTPSNWAPPSIARTYPAVGKVEMNRREPTHSSLCVKVCVS